MQYKNDIIHASNTVTSDWSPSRRLKRVSRPVRFLPQVSFDGMFPIHDRRNELARRSSKYSHPLDRGAEKGILDRQGRQEDLQVLIPQDEVDQQGDEEG
jgi:hypothetical protein